MVCEQYMYFFNRTKMKSLYLLGLGLTYTGLIESQEDFS